jgi:hypothetical protein
LQGYLATHGCPVAFYSDKHSVFRINRDAQGGSGMTQFGRALAELNIEIICANDILCHREQRYVGAQLTFHYDRNQIILERSELSEGLGGKYVDLYEFPDGRLEVRWKGHSLPYRVFSKDTRNAPVRFTGQTTKQNSQRAQRWKCRPDGKERKT